MVKSTLVPVLAAVVIVIISAATTEFVAATYIKGVGYNLERDVLPIPRQAHHIDFPQVDTSTVARAAVREAAVVCDPIVPVQRIVNCELHLFDECGNPYGHDFNVTHNWNVVVQELDYGNRNLSPNLISPTVWLQKGVGRFYFTPIRRGLHRVALTRRAWPYAADLQHTFKLGQNNGGFTVKVHGVMAKGLSHNLGETNAAVRQMLWAAASANAEPRQYPPSMPPTFTYEDKRHQFDDRRYGNLQENVRRPPIQPYVVPVMPLKGAPLDDNAHRILDVVFP